MDIFSASESLTARIRRTIRLAADVTKTDSGFGKSVLVESVAEAKLNVIGDRAMVGERRLFGVLEAPGYLTPPFEFTSLSSSVSARLA